MKKVIITGAVLFVGLLIVCHGDDKRGSCGACISARNITAARSNQSFSTMKSCKSYKGCGYCYNGCYCNWNSYCWDPYYRCCFYYIPTSCCYYYWYKPGCCFYP